jgi:hypothetical protein
VDERSLGAATVWARDDYGGLEVGVSRRGGQGRFGLSATGGSGGGELALRLEARGQFLLVPTARTGPAYYAGLGFAFAGARARRGAAYLTMLLGVETAAWRPQGWYAELGLGGGLRVAAGMRWRRFPAWLD